MGVIAVMLMASTSPAWFQTGAATKPEIAS